MNASQLFTAAHATARTATTGSYRARFSTALRAVYAAAKAPVKRAAADIIEEVFGADFELSVWKGGEKVRVYITAPAQSRAYQQVGFIDVVANKFNLSVHPARTDRGRAYNALMQQAITALAA